MDEKKLKKAVKDAEDGEVAYTAKQCNDAGYTDIPLADKHDKLQLSKLDETAYDKKYKVEGSELCAIVSNEASDRRADEVGKLKNLFVRATGETAFKALTDQDVSRLCRDFKEYERTGEVPGVDFVEDREVSSMIAPYNGIVRASGICKN